MISFCSAADRPRIAFHGNAQILGSNSQKFTAFSQLNFSAHYYYSLSGSYEEKKEAQRNKIAYPFRATKKKRNATRLRTP